jgi:hypothetical protein
VIGAATTPNAATIGAALYVDLFGGWIVPPARRSGAGRLGQHGRRHGDHRRDLA